MTTHPRPPALALVLGLVLVSAFACRHASGTSQLDDLAYDRSATNVALFFGAANGLPGVPLDISENERLFRTLDLGFEVRAFNDATKELVLAETRRAAADVGATGTLLWYFSGHGSEDGKMVTAGYQGSDFDHATHGLVFAEVAEAIKGVRSAPIKRLLVVIDNCFSGRNLEQVIRGGKNYALTPVTYDDSRSTVAEREATTKRAAEELGDESALYEQALIMTASRDSETSLDTPMGGAFSAAWRETIEDLKRRSEQGESPTLGTLFIETRAKVAGWTKGHHTPQRALFQKRP